MSLYIIIGSVFLLGYVFGYLLGVSQGGVGV